MTTTLTKQSLPSAGHVTLEAGGWITCRMPQPETTDQAARLLTSVDEHRPGNLRLASNQDQVFLIGELRKADGLTLREASERMFTPTTIPTVEVSPDELYCMLAETGHEWSPAEGDQLLWKANVSGTAGRCELSATLVSGGVLVRGGLATWEEDLSEESQLALGKFLTAANSQVRFARFTFESRAASAVSFASADRLETELPDSVAAVVSACYLTRREVAALTHAPVAQAYLAAAH